VAALWCLAPDIGRWMGLDATLNGIATTYLASISAYFIFLGVLVAYNAVLSSRGMTNWLMYSSFVVSALNLALASLFVLGFHWGVRGVVAASVTSTAAATMESSGGSKLCPPTPANREPSSAATRWRSQSSSGRQSAG